MIVLEGPISALKKGINNTINTYNYLAGNRNSRFDFKFKAKDSEVRDTAFKDFMNIRKFSYDAKTDPDNGVVQVSFDATKVPNELADKIDPDNKNKNDALYKYIKSYNDGKVVMEFPMVSRQKKKKDKNKSESVMTPTPTPYQNRFIKESQDEEDKDIIVEPELLEIKYEDDDKVVAVQNKDTDIYVMTDVKVTESVGLKETPGLTLSDPTIKDSKLTIEINGKTYTYEVKEDSDKSPEDVAKSVTKMRKFSDGKALAYLKKNMKLVKEAALVSSKFNGTGTDDLITDLFNATIDYLKNKGFTRDRATDLFNIDWHQDEDTILIEVRAEISDEDKEELAITLDPLIINYDRESYFDEDSEGVLSAILYKENINPAMLESLKLESKYVGVEYTYDGDDVSDYLGHINVDSSDGEDRALEIAMDYVTSTRPEVNPRDFKITKNKYKNVEYLDKTGKVVDLKEGNSFKDHHICQGCGKPLSQCTCKVEEEDIDLENLEEDATQVSNVGQHKVDSIDLVESQSGDTVDYKDWDGEIVKGLTINTKEGHKLTIKDFKVYFNPFEESDINMKIDYDYETSDGRKGSSSCNQVSLWRMVHGKRY